MIETRRSAVATMMELNTSILTAIAQWSSSSSPVRRCISRQTNRSRSCKEPFIAAANVANIGTESEISRSATRILNIATPISSFESAIWNFESKMRNCFRVAGDCQRFACDGFQVVEDASRRCAAAAAVPRWLQCRSSLHSRCSRL